MARPSERDRYKYGICTNRVTRMEKEPLVLNVKVKKYRK